MSNNGTLVRNLTRGGSGGGSGGGSATEVALLSVTTAPSGSFAVGSKYYDSTEKKIYTAITADTWTGATSADPVFNTIYTYDSGYYKWDGDNLVSTDVDAFLKGATVNGVSVVDANKIAVIPNASSSVFGVVKVDGSTITAIDGVISSAGGGSSLENVMYFAPTGAGTEDGSSWENAKAFNAANYTAMTAGFVALLKFGTYTISDNITLTSDKQLLGGFVGIDLLRERCSVVRSDNVQGKDGVTVFNTYATIITGAVVGENIVYGELSGDNTYIDNIVFKGNAITGGGHSNPTIIKNCIFANYEGNVIEHCGGFNFDNIYILNCKGKGIVLDGYSYLTNSKIFNCSSNWDSIPLEIHYGTAINCTIEKSGSGIKYKTAVVLGDYGDGKIFDSRIINCPTGGIENQKGVDRIVNCTIENCTSRPGEGVAIIGYEELSTNTIVKDCKQIDLGATHKTIDIIGGVQYQFGTLDDLTISSVQTSQTKSTIYFTTSAGFTAFTATGIPRLDAVTVIAEKSYKIEVENGIMEVKEVI